MTKVFMLLSLKNVLVVTSTDLAKTKQTKIKRTKFRSETKSLFLTQDERICQENYRELTKSLFK